MMVVEPIKTLPEFERIRDAYERAYERDPHHTVFVSWAWLRSYFASMAPEWLVLAVRREGEYIAFATLVSREARVGPIVLHREAALGAYPTSDYTSLVIAEEKEACIDALAGAIAALEWDVLRARNVRDPRVAPLVERLAAHGHVLAEPPTPCRYVPLPSSWDAYAALARRHCTRRPCTVVRARRAWTEAQFTDANDATIDGSIEILLQLHHRRWQSNLGEARRTYGRLFREAYDRGCCRISVLKRGDAPVAAQAIFANGEPRIRNLYMIAADRSQSRAPGLGILARDIERAIAEGVVEYDFLRGDETYKAHFGAELRQLENATLRRRGVKARVGDRLWEFAVRAKGPVRRFLLRMHLLRERA